MTGTNGKTTTVELIGHIHREAGLPVAVAGNVGTALSSLIGELDGDSTVVCEASSFQLEDTLEFAPQAAVLLNITPDHLDRHGTLEAYAAAKLEIFARQEQDDVAVLPADLGERIDWAGAPAIPGEAQRVEFGWEPQAALFELDGELWWHERALIALAAMRLRGRHNVENAMAAAAVCLARGIEPAAVRAGLASFPGVAHRLEELADARRRALRQRLEGNQRGEHAGRARGLHGAPASPDPGRSGQGAGLHQPARAGRTRLRGRLPDR